MIYYLNIIKKLDINIMNNFEIRMSLKLISIPFCANNSRNRFPRLSNTALINTFPLNDQFKFYKNNCFFNIMNKMNMNFINVIQFQILLFFISKPSCANNSRTISI